MSPDRVGSERKNEYQAFERDYYQNAQEAIMLDRDMILNSWQANGAAIGELYDHVLAVDNPRELSEADHHVKNLIDDLRNLVNSFESNNNPNLAGPIRDTAQGLLDALTALPTYGEGPTMSAYPAIADLTDDVQNAMAD